jgi:hypothetical protein
MALSVGVERVDSSSAFGDCTSTDSSDGHDDGNQEGSDSRNKRDQCRTTPQLLSTEDRHQKERYYRHAEHRIRIADCRPDQEDDYGDCPEPFVSAGVRVHRGSPFHAVWPIG